MTVIDGATNSYRYRDRRDQPRAIAVNPVTNKIYVTNQISGNFVTVITEQPVQAIPLTTTITPLTGQ